MATEGWFFAATCSFCGLRGFCESNKSLRTPSAGLQNLA